MNEIKVRVNIELWKSRLELRDWKIITVGIIPEQVVYADDVPEEDRYFIGILPARGTKEARIFHDRPLKEEDIVHELLHVKHPNWSQEKVLSYQDFVIEHYKDIEAETIESFSLNQISRHHSKGWLSQNKKK